MNPKEIPNQPKALLNPRQRRFAEGYVSGLSASRAYREAGYKAEGHAAESAASKLLRRPDVVEFVRDLRRGAEEASRMTRDELARFLSAVILTPIGLVDETSPMVQEMTSHVVGDMTTVTSIKMVPKIEAARQLAVLCGWTNTEDTPRSLEDRVSSLVMLIRRARPSGD